VNALTLAATPIVDSTDRPAWLAARRAGVTATEVRDIRIGRTTVEQVAQEKVAGEDGAWLGNIPTVAWGNFREDAIAAELERRYAIRGNRVLYGHGVHSRRLATPDGIGAELTGEVIIAEIKTGAADLTVGGAAFVKKGYGWQIQWQLLVMDAVTCCFAWERHDNDFTRFDTRNPRVEDGPVMEALQVEWVERDEAAIAELIVIADAVLEAVDTLRAGDELVPVIDEAIDTDALNYLRGLAEEKAGAELKVKSFDSLKKRMAASDAAFVQVSALARVSWPARVTETGHMFGPVDESALPASVAARVARERQVLATHQERARKAQERLDALLTPYKPLVTTTSEKSRKPTVTAVKAKESKEQAA
jgi:hypothetical protein